MLLQQLQEASGTTAVDHSSSEADAPVTPNEAGAGLMDVEEVELPSPLNDYTEGIDALAAPG